MNYIFTEACEYTLPKFKIQTSMILQMIVILHTVCEMKTLTIIFFTLKRIFTSLIKNTVHDLITFQL